MLMRTISVAWLAGLRVRAPLSYLTAFVAAIVIFLWHIGSQTIGLGPDETKARAAAKLSNIWINPLNAPYKLVQNALYHSGLGHILALRLTSALIAMVIAAAFFYVFRAWFGKPIALLGTLLFAVTPLYLISARLATPDIMFSASVLLMAAYHKASLARSKSASVYILLALVVCLYTPGLIWLLLAAAIYWRQRIYDMFNDLSLPQRTGLLLALLILLSPLARAFIVEPDLVRHWLLWPASMPAPKVFVKNLAWGVSALFFRSPLNSQHNLSGIPLLDALQIGLVIFGAYVIFSRLRGVFFWLLATGALVLIVNAFNFDYTHLLILLPLLAFLSTMGLRYLFLEWRKVFPRNPLAQTFAIMLMALVVAMHLFYGVRFSLLAWPAAPRIHSSYVLK